MIVRWKCGAGPLGGPASPSGRARTAAGAWRRWPGSARSSPAGAAPAAHRPAGPSRWSHRCRRGSAVLGMTWADPTRTGPPGHAPPIHCGQCQRPESRRKERYVGASASYSSAKTGSSDAYVAAAAGSGRTVLLDPHQVGGDVDAVDQPERLHAEQRRAEAGPLVPCRELDRHAERVGEHLPPQRAAGEPAGGADLADLVAGCAHRASTSASCWQTPSSAARIRCSRRWARVSPTYAPRGSALQCGARSLSRYGSMISPPEPTGARRGEVEQLLLGVARRGRGRARRRPTRSTMPPLLIAPPTTQRSLGQRVAEHPAERVDRRAAPPSPASRRWCRSSRPPRRGAPRPGPGWPAARRRAPTTTGVPGRQPGRAAASAVSPGSTVVVATSCGQLLRR